MTDAILVVNAGSSSLKFAWYRTGATLALAQTGIVDDISGNSRFIAKDAQGATIATRDWKRGELAGHDGAIEFLLEFLREQTSELRDELGGETRLAGVGHRIVHGGAHYVDPVRITPAIVDDLEKLAPLAPLHQPHNLLPIRILMQRSPALPQVACFDTAFHRTAPKLAMAFALPREMSDAGIRRYGFHGLSYEYIAGRLREIDPAVAAGRVVVAHLGNGASMCALVDGKSVATTMGFTAIDGLVMGTRTGSIDPGVLLYLQRERGMDADALENLLYRQSGLLGVSGIASDVRALLASTDPMARYALDLFAYRAVCEIGALAAAMGGIDALVFTAGIGEHAPAVRAKIVSPLGWLGFALDANNNAGSAPSIGAEGGKPVYVIPTDEELMIARHTLSLLAR